MLVIGIDPGISGSICFFQDGKIIDVVEMPTMIEGKKNKKQVNGSQIFNEISYRIKKIDKKDIKEVADALTDILYVTYGAGHAFGIDLDKCFDEVQNSNMSKLDENGKPIYNESGKVMKGPSYFKPDLSKFVN